MANFKTGLGDDKNSCNTNVIKVYKHQDEGNANNIPKIAFVSWG
jgi:hypothetical protein